MRDAVKGAIDDSSQEEGRPFPLGAPKKASSSPSGYSWGRPPVVFQARDKDDRLILNARESLIELGFPQPETLLEIEGNHFYGNDLASAIIQGTGFAAVVSKCTVSDER